MGCRCRVQPGGKCDICPPLTDEEKADLWWIDFCSTGMVLVCGSILAAFVVVWIGKGCPVLP